MPACPSCGSPIEAAARYCGECGTEVPRVRVQVAAAAPIESLRAETRTLPGFASQSDLAERARRLEPAGAPAAEPAGSVAASPVAPAVPTADDSDELPTSRAVPGVIVGAATALVVLAATAIAAAVLPGDDDAPMSSASQNVAAEADVKVPDTARDGADNAGNRVSYDASNLVDDDPRTAWRVDGSAEGEQLVLTLPESTAITEVGLINGYAKVDRVGDDDRYHQNRRVLEATWSFDDGTETTQTFDDTIEPQVLTLDEPVTTRKVRLRLTEVSAAHGRDYTAISEIHLTGSP